ncbi:MAG: D-alanine--D-alanine ligase [Solirubrobacteraceae bacterium]|jgi:D-alanine-D-alanine ligase
MTRVAVLKGGGSLERQVSLSSGARVEDALERLGHEVIGIDVGGDVLARIRDADCEVAFIALHGPGGEDGTLQELLEVLRLPYTGSGVSACARCSDKVLAKHALRDAGLPTPDWVAFSEKALRDFGAAEALEEIEERLDFPLVVKPASQGSALGIKFARAPTDVPAALVAAFSYDRKVLLERYVRGRELAVSLLGRVDGTTEVLPIVEAVPQGQDFYDFAARYEIGRTAFVCPAALEEALTERAQEVALAAYELLGCYGFARVDMIVAADSYEPQILEVNPIPGLTDTSLLPQAADAAGVGFDELVGRIVELAQARTARTG